jgi:signal transduction histidine kinase/CheY-like chemotaxis protein
MRSHVIPREIPLPAELSRPVHPGENGELMGHLAEIAALCSRVQSDLGAVAEPGDVFRTALPVLRRLADFRAIGLFIVDGNGVDFVPAGVDPDDEESALEREMALQVEEGTFTWALYRNHAVIVPARGRRGRVLMHALSTSSGVRGMFFGLLPGSSSYIPEVTRELISVVLFTCAGVLESSALNRRLTSYSEELEATVRTRTRALRSSEQDAREANRVKSEFLAHTSHEIRAPINGVIGTLSLLKRTPMAGEQRAYVETIDRSARVLLRLASDILDLSRIEAGRMRIERTAMALRDVIDGAVDLVSARARERGLGLWVEWDRRLPVRMAGDAGRVRQILTNLLDNAVKYTPAGEVRVRCSFHDAQGRESVRIRVQDTGPGIAPEDRERVFDRFAQAERGGGADEHGSGLGLAIARDLARLMDGDLVLEAGADAGSTFTLDLPVILAEHPAPPPDGGDREVILVTRSARLTACIEEEVGWLGGTVATLDSLQAASVYLDGGDGRHPILVDADVAPLDVIRATLSGADRVVVLGGPDARPAAGGLAVLGRPWRTRRLRETLGWTPVVEPRTREEPAAVDAGAFAGTRVLVVDDDAVSRTVLGWILGELGCRHESVATGEEALERVSVGAYDVVLMDSQLPGLDGGETTRRIRGMEGPARARPLRIIGVTGRAGDDARAELLGAGMEDVLVKPITLDAIAGVLLDGHPEPLRGPGEETLESAGIVALTKVWPERRQALREAAADGNLTSVAQEAHRMKGAGALVGAHEVADLSAALEMAAQMGNRARVGPLTEELEAVVAAFLDGGRP